MTALVLAMAMLACDADEKSQSPIAQVLTAIVRSAADELPPREDPEELPVVYVISGTEQGLPATAQAAVANVLNGEIDVRFADGRAEALDDSEPGAPVRDDGGLVIVGDLRSQFEDDPDEVEVVVELYRSETQFSRRRFTFSGSGDAWSATSSSLLEELDVAPTTEPPPEDTDGETEDGGDEDGGDEDGGDEDGGDEDAVAGTAVETEAAVVAAG